MSTEDRNVHAEEIDLLTTEEIIDWMVRDYDSILIALRETRRSIEQLVEDAVRRFRAGGRLFYVGAGTSGRLGVIEAAELYPTFGIASGRVKAVMAGGKEAVFASMEGAEDDEDSGRGAMEEATGGDIVIGISASGKTPFVLSALREAKRRGAGCWLITSNPLEYGFLDGLVFLRTGPEMVAGSTRMKAGTAAKIVLNIISTAVMIRLGKVYRGYMVDLVPLSRKLKRRAIRIVSNLTGIPEEEAEDLLQRSGWAPKKAIVMKARGVSPGEAEELLLKAGGSLRKVLE
jgi:N-acetylmuramic acid 6-phosphate etherase